MTGARSDTRATRIAICVATRRRPAGLARLFESVSKLILPSGVAAEVIVVENDEPHTDPLPSCTLTTRRVFEPMQGIPVARNRALDEVPVECDWIMFLDDDETVDPLILARLLDAARTNGVTVATGPALPCFEPGSATWATRSEAYEPVRHPHLSRVRYAFTNNVLFSARVARPCAATPAMRFDESMLHTGGSDREFFSRLAKNGHEIVWVDDAIAYEWYPPERATQRWLFQRSYRLGTVAPATEGLAKAGVLPLAARLMLGWRAVRFFGRGIVRALKRSNDPACAIALAAWDFGRSSGLVAAMIGVTYEEYRSR